MSNSTQNKKLTRLQRLRVNVKKLFSLSKSNFLVPSQNSGTTSTCKTASASAALAESRKEEKKRRDGRIANLKKSNPYSYLSSGTGDNNTEYVCPVTRSKTPHSANYVTLCETSALKPHPCGKCKNKFLDLSRVAPPSKYSDPFYLHVTCQECSATNTVRLFNPDNSCPAEPGRKRNPIIRNAVLGAIHSGMGATQLSGFMAAIDARPFSETTFKKAEREVGPSIETIAREGCEKWMSIEKERSSDGIKASYDFGWQKNKRSHNSKTGQGTVVGYQTRKCIDYTAKSSYCRICYNAQKRNEPAPVHDCRKNHQGSSKSMEACAAVELFSKENYTVLIGDDDSTVISRINSEVDSSIIKWSDANHALCSFKRKLYEHRGKSLNNSDNITDSVIEHLAKCFSYCLYQNKNDPKELKAGLERIVPHTFGDHRNCQLWCKYNEDPQNYKHATLPGGRDLKGESLRQLLDNIIQGYTSDDAVKKLAPLGSSQVNECINNIVQSKNPKSRFYGGSESSDFRIAAAVAQYNEGYSYLEKVKYMVDGIAEPFNLSTYTTQMNRKRKMNSTYKSQTRAKARRRTLKTKSQSKKNRQEQKEGTTYQSGIGFTTVVTEEDVKRCNGTSGNEVVQRYLSDNNLIQNLTKPFDKCCTTPAEELAICVFDIETTGFAKTSEIIQLSCSSLTGSDSASYSNYAMAHGSISASATKVHHISVGVENGRRVLMKDNRQLQAPPLSDVLDQFAEYLENVSSSKRSLLLIGHNAHTFDAPRLVRAIVNDKRVASQLQGKVILFGDSLGALKQQLQRTRNVKLSDVYQEVTQETFNAHDATEDVIALKRVINHYGKPLLDSIVKRSKPLEYYAQLNDYNQLLTQCKLSYQGRITLNTEIVHLSKLGISYSSLKKAHDECGRDAIISFLAIKVGSKPQITNDHGKINQIILSLK